MYLGTIVLSTWLGLIHQLQVYSMVTIHGMCHVSVLCSQHEPWLGCPPYMYTTWTLPPFRFGSTVCVLYLLIVVLLTETEKKSTACAQDCTYILFSQVCSCLGV